MDKIAERAGVAKLVLLEYGMTKQDAQTKAFDLHEIPENEMKKSFLVFKELRDNLGNVINKADNRLDLLKNVENFTRGEGINVSEEDEDMPQVNIISAINQSRSSSKESKQAYALLTKCCNILEKRFTKGQVINLWEADFLSRTGRMLIGSGENFGVLYKAITNKQKIPETPSNVKQDLQDVYNTMASIENLAQNEPYVKLRKLFCSLFGQGAINDFDNVILTENRLKSKMTSFDLSTKEGLCEYVNLIIKLKDKTVAENLKDYSASMVRNIKDISNGFLNELQGKAEGYLPVVKTNQKDIFTAYDILKIYLPTLEVKDANGKYLQSNKIAKGVKEAESVLKNTIKEAVGDDTLILEAAGVGQLFNPLRYQGEEQAKLEEVLKCCAKMQRGFSDIQNKLIEASRVVSGMVNFKKNITEAKYGGPSWFIDAMKKTSVNNLEIDPEYKIIIRNSIESAVSYMYSLKSEIVRLKSLPIELISPKDSEFKAVEKRLSEAEKVYENIKKRAFVFLEKDFAKEVEDALALEEISVKNFHRMNNIDSNGKTVEALVNDWLIGFIKGLSSKNGQANIDFVAHLNKKFKSDANDNYKTTFLRLSEICGVFNKMDEQTQNLYYPANIQRLDAYKAINAITSQLNAKNSLEQTESLLEIFSGYSKWDEFYEKKIKEKCEERKEFEINRVKIWQTVLKDALLELEGDYIPELIKVNKIANVMQSALLMDSILKASGKREVKKIEDVFSIVHRLFDKSQKQEWLERMMAQLGGDREDAERSIRVMTQAEDAALELFMPVYIKENFNAIIEKTDTKFNSVSWDTGKEKGKNYKIKYFNYGGVMNFDENVIAKEFKDLKETFDILEGAKRAVREERKWQYYFAEAAKRCFDKESCLATLEMITSPTFKYFYRGSDFYTLSDIKGIVANNVLPPERIKRLLENCSRVESGAKDILQWAKEKLQNELGKKFLVYSDEEKAGASGYSAEDLKEFFEEALTDWESGNKDKVYADIDKAISENKFPLFKYYNGKEEFSLKDVRGALRDEKLDVKSVLSACRWAGLLAQYNSKIGASEELLMKASNAEIEKTKKLCEEKVEKAPRLLDGTKELSFQLYQGLIKVFSPESGLLMAQGLEVKNLDTVLTHISNAKNVLNEQEYISFFNGLLKQISQKANDLVQTVQYEPFKSEGGVGQINSIQLLNKDNENYKAGDKPNPISTNTLISLQNGITKTVSIGYEDLASIVHTKKEKTATEYYLSRDLTSEIGEGATDIEKWNSSYSKGAEARGFIKKIEEGINASNYNMDAILGI